MSSSRATVPTQSSLKKSRVREPEWLVLGLAALGLLVTGYLSFVAWREGIPAFCAEGSDCELIQHSRWSRVLGLPLALWGFALYALLAYNAWRLPARLLRWRRLWLSAFFGLCISLYLTLVSWIELEAFCAWCLLSLALLAAIFVRVTLIRPKSAPGIGWQPWLINSTVAAAIALGALHLYYSDMFAPRESPRLQALASHLRDSGARFYGAYWCGTCQEQKHLFGSSAKRLPYIECTPNGRNGLLAPACLSAQINSYPTWIIRGERHHKLLSIDELTRLSRFKWREPKKP
ncbi:vitamin K epoxide reductase family protein [Pseudomonas zhanjiangensis]|uniref:Vitamin K epoxide reductase family protein n=1 Tax=Pseudomonas zhanjiangensis TaxID=3239015 RepID=A0ABV3Z0I3_9PSED